MLLCLSVRFLIGTRTVVVVQVHVCEVVVFVACVLLAAVFVGLGRVPDSVVFRLCGRNR